MNNTLNYLKTMRWHVFVSLLLFHVVALVGWYFYTWQALVAGLVLYQITGHGITCGYHRYLTHGSFKACRPVHWALTLMGMTAGQGAPVEWVATHRKHHVTSDTEDDPHSPHHGGFFWSHMAWLWHPFSVTQKAVVYRRYARDLLSDPFVRFVSKASVYVAWLFATFFMIGALGYWIGGWPMCWSFLAYGVFLRLVLVYHVTWFVNSATHMWGYRSHETGDQSRNLWWVGLLASGEGWHNNHHAHQRVANHGQSWWEVDTTYWMIRFLAFLRLAWNVSYYNPSTGKVEIRYKRE